MTAWFYDGHIPAGILLIMLLEFLFLAISRPAVLRRLWPSLAAGFLLLLAWIMAAFHVPWSGVAAALLLAGGCHATDVARRWR
jgi:hypothetical protein